MHLYPSCHTLNRFSAVIGGVFSEFGELSEVWTTLDDFPRPEFQPPSLNLSSIFCGAEHGPRADVKACFTNLKHLHGEESQPRTAATRRMVAGVALILGPLIERHFALGAACRRRDASSGAPHDRG